jgi:anaerobic ribonucleoside-triphosphate reductase activating protein
MLKYVNTGIVFQEIPDEVTFAINISNCPCRCPGCHSSYLWGDVGQPLTSRTLDTLLKDKKDDITCVAFMGGDAEAETVNELARFVHASYPRFRVAWYSGRVRIAREVCKTDFDYIKVGPYIAHLGPLNKRTTNQRLYKQQRNRQFEDITSRFWKK